MIKSNGVKNFVPDVLPGQLVPVTPTLTVQVDDLGPHHSAHVSVAVFVYRRETEIFS